MAVAIEIRHARQPPAGRKSWAVRGVGENVVVEVPYRCLTGAGSLKHIVRFAVAIKVSHSSPGYGARRTRQIVTNDVEIDTLRRCRRDIGKLACTTKCILDIRVRLGTGGAQPITEIAARILAEISDSSAATVNRKIACAA